MMRTNKGDDVKAGFDTMGQARREAVVGKLAPRLWALARVEKSTDNARGDQIAAKDMLFAIRKYASAEQVKQIDQYLTDWYAVEAYEGRANTGGFTGPKVLRTIGAPASKKMIEVMNTVIAGPKNTIGDALMLALAAVGTPEAVKELLDVARLKRIDKTVGKRAMDALAEGFISNNALFDVNPPDALAGNINQLASIVKDENVSPDAAVDAIELIRAAGQPACYQPLIDMVGYPHKDENFLYMAVQSALICGGPKKVSEIVRAIPDGTYDGLAVTGTFVSTIAKQTPKQQVLDAVRELAGDKKVLPRWIAMEKDGTKLVGYWGPGTPEADAKKPDPTLGQRAKEIADLIEKGDTGAPAASGGGGSSTGGGAGSAAGSGSAAPAAGSGSGK
jgi:hypothetical protein